MDRMSGVSGAAPLFHSIMRELGSGGSFDRPASLRSARICPASGHRPGAHCPAPQREWFLPGTVPSDTCSVHRLVALNTRTGRRATQSTDPTVVDSTLYTVYPDRYHDWMRSNDVPLPPPAPHTASARQVRTPSVADRLRIQYPADDARFYVDPVLRRNYQKISLRGTVPDGVHDVHWVIDGTRHASGLREVTWQLAPGRHRIQLRGRHNGQVVRSAPVAVRVVAADARSHTTARRRSP
jgi:penicillin-binding protein 1C